MLSDGISIGLMSRLQTMNRVLDQMVPDSPLERFGDTVEVRLGPIARQDITKAITAFKAVLQANPYWLRGYLLLATIFEYADQSSQAITTLEQGLEICAQGVHVFRAPRWIEMVKQISGSAGHERIRRSLERFRRYERIFRHRMAMLQVHQGRFDEAIEQWSILEEEHCV